MEWTPGHSQWLHWRAKHSRAVDTVTMESKEPETSCGYVVYPRRVEATRGVHPRKNGGAEASQWAGATGWA
eukprot:3775254-Pyramimonas_sp.AAC.1